MDIQSANKLRDDLQRVRVLGWSNGLNWNIEAKMHMNADRNDRKKLTCPSLEFLKLLCHACENSEWCSHYYLTSRNGQSIPCGADSIDDLEVDFDEPQEPELDRAEVEFTCDDARQDTRAIMKVPRRCVEVVNMLCHDVDKLRVESARARDMRALARSHRAMYNEVMRTEPDICASCKRECDAGTCCNICGRPLCDDGWSGDGTGMPELCGIGRCLRQLP